MAVEAGGISERPGSRPCPRRPVTIAILLFADVGAFAIDPQQPDILYAGGYAGVSKSTDGGASWKVMNGGLPLPTGVDRINHFWTVGNSSDLMIG